MCPTSGPCSWNDWVLLSPLSFPQSRDSDIDIAMEPALILAHEGNTFCDGEQWESRNMESRNDSMQLGYLHAHNQLTSFAWAIVVLVSVIQFSLHPNRECLEQESGMIWFIFQKAQSSFHVNKMLGGEGSG